MQRQQLEHIIRAASAITGASEWIIIGSQAILGSFPHPPAALCASVEADLFTFRDQADSDLIDGSIGEGSPFHQTFGYYAHGVAEETAILPEGWKGRLVAIQNDNTGGGTGLCIEVHDLAVSKLMAGREKDIEFIAELIGHGFAKEAVINERLDRTNVDPARRLLCWERLNRLLGRRS